MQRYKRARSPRICDGYGNAGKCDQTITCQISELLAQRTARGLFRGSGVWV